MLFFKLLFLFPLVVIGISIGGSVAVFVSSSIGFIGVNIVGGIFGIGLCHIGRGGTFETRHPMGLERGSQCSPIGALFLFPMP